MQYFIFSSYNFLSCRTKLGQHPIKRKTKKNKKKTLLQTVNGNRSIQRYENILQYCSILRLTSQFIRSTLYIMQNVFCETKKIVFTD